MNTVSINQLSTMFLIISTILLLSVVEWVVIADDNVPIPADKTQLNTWFMNNVKSISYRKGKIDPNLEAAELKRAKVIRVRKDGSGNFKTITNAIKSIDPSNSKRVIIHIGGGTYKEKIKIDRTMHFITLYGSPNNMPSIEYNGDAKKYGTVNSATLIVESDYFMATNIIVANTSPKPDGKRYGAQAVALRISGDKAAFYNCRFLGFQDTICDDRGFHFFKDCYIEGTVDYIFGSGTSLYLNNELHVIADYSFTVITAQARQSNAEDTGFSFVHCTITGTAKANNTFLGRAWMRASRTIFAYTKMSNVVNSLGWSNCRHPERERTVEFGEYKNTGAGAITSGRVKFGKQLSASQVKPFLSLSYIVGSKWLLPPPKI
ncbi:hypothetical protein SAY87_015125 [Trapa incisa]|uniref:Pectinesterase n=1 Tax=Trapa incisa TaxID=236973 RepID=A0AAN7JKT6_9MYRT|nr:hypothetical protein SAY87_015125 [Trapa incisa]